MVVANADGEIWESSRAGEDIATLGAVVLRTTDLLIVGVDNAVIHEKKGGTGVSDGVDARVHESTIANLVTSASKFPEALRVIDWGVGDVTSVLAAVNEAEVVCTWSTLLQISREHILLKNAFIDGSVEESGLCLRLDCIYVSAITSVSTKERTSVDGAESKPKQTVVIGVLLELCADGLRKLHSLTGDGGAADVDSISVHITAGTGPISVGDFPGRTSQFLCSA